MNCFTNTTNPLMLQKYLFLDVKPCGLNGPLVFNNDDTGYIQSPTFPNNVLPSLQCEWWIKVPKEKTTVVRIILFDTKER